MKRIVGLLLALGLGGGVVASLAAQEPQNPSPMVEHIRAHPRLRQTNEPGRRLPLEIGGTPATLFLPARLGHKRLGIRLLLFFHGGHGIPEAAAAGVKNLAVMTVQAGAGSSRYARLFADPGAFPSLLATAESRSGVRFNEVDLGGWSAGCGALARILSQPAAAARVTRVLCIDGINIGYAEGKPGPLESQLKTAELEPWLRFGQAALTGKKRLIITHSEIFPGTYASTTETAYWLLTQWGLRPRAVLKWGPMGTQMLSRVQAGGLLVAGFAGNSAPDHVDQLESLPEYLKWLFR